MWKHLTSNWDFRKIRTESVTLCRWSLLFFFCENGNDAKVLALIIFGVMDPGPLYPPLGTASMPLMLFLAPPRITTAVMVSRIAIATTCASGRRKRCTWKQNETQSCFTSACWKHELELRYFGFEFFRSWVLAGNEFELKVLGLSFSDVWMLKAQV